MKRTSALSKALETVLNKLNNSAQIMTLPMLTKNATMAEIAVSAGARNHLVELSVNLLIHAVATTLAAQDLEY